MFNIVDIPSSMPSASSEADELYRLARAIQHRSGLSKASFATEDCRFREYFGVSVIVALAAWRLLVKHDLLPDETEVGVASPEHMLWVMYFLKCYPRTGEGCGAAGGSTRKNSAVDPKTWRKYIWPMIYSLSDLCDKSFYWPHKSNLMHNNLSLTYSLDLL